MLSNTAGCIAGSQRRIRIRRRIINRWYIRNALPDVSGRVLGEGVQRAGWDLDDGSRVVGLQHLDGGGIHRLLKGQLDVVLAVEGQGGPAEGQRRAGALLPPRPVHAEDGRLREVARAGEDVGRARQVPHGVGHAVLASVVRAEVQHLLGVLLHLHAQWEGPLVGLYGPPAVQDLAPGPAPGPPPQTYIVKHAQKG